MGFLSELLSDMQISSDDSNVVLDSRGLTFLDTGYNIPVEDIDGEQTAELDDGEGLVEVFNTLCLWNGFAIRLDWAVTKCLAEDFNEARAAIDIDSSVIRNPYLKLGCPRVDDFDVTLLSCAEARKDIDAAVEDFELYEALCSQSGVTHVDALWGMLRLLKLSVWYDVTGQTDVALRNKILAVAAQWEEGYVKGLLKNVPAQEETGDAVDMLEMLRFRLNACDTRESSLSRYQRWRSMFLRMDIADKDLNARLLGCLSEVADDVSAKARKVLVCNGDKRTALGVVTRSADVLLCTAEDIEYANLHFNAGLIFQPGHPQNGCTYIQHPFRNQMYFEVNSYHDSLREMKQNELLKILESLGAFSARVEVRYSQNIILDTLKKSHAEIVGSCGGIVATGQHNGGEECNERLSKSQSMIKEWTFNPPGIPAIPNDLVFYPTEETWQQLASSVLRGGLKKAIVDFEYKTEYGISEKFLGDVSVSLKVMVPSYEMNLKKEFSSELQRLEATQWHYDVSFEDENGHRAGLGEKNVDSNVSEDSTRRAEQLFLKRARRYAQSEGHINMDQRADLEAFAQKYGIDDFRMEELIEDAFA